MIFERRILRGTEASKMATAGMKLMAGPTLGTAPSLLSRAVSYFFFFDVFFFVASDLGALAFFAMSPSHFLKENKTK